MLRAVTGTGAWLGLFFAIKAGLASFMGWLARRGRVGIGGLDTRRLTRAIRQQGAPHVALAHDPEGSFDIEALVARARALGCSEDRKGTAAAAIPTPPVTAAATLRKWRRLRSKASSSDIWHSNTPPQPGGCQLGSGRFRVTM